MPLIDSFGRLHTSLRISVTDRCNIRCFYCMPEHVNFLPRKEILSFEEIERIVGILAGLGVNKLRLTGGEPLVRKNLPRLIAGLKQIDGIEELALTTNGVLLENQASQLKTAGLDRLNISLDSLDDKTYQAITRRSGLDKVLRGIESALDAGFSNLRLNAVAIKGLSEDSALPLAIFCFKKGLHLRFIEFMPLDGDQNWNDESVLSGETLREILSSEFGPATPLQREDPSQPATDFEFENGAIVGFINSVTQPFCASCNRLRLTAEGRLRNCLFSNVDFDLRTLVRSDAGDKEIIERIKQCVGEKKQGHGINSDEFQRPARAMYQIGG